METMQMGCFMELIRKERGCQTVPPKARKPGRARDLRPAGSRLPRPRPAQRPRVPGERAAQRAPARGLPLGTGTSGRTGLLPRLLSETETAAAGPPSGSQAPGALADPQGCSLPPALLGTRGPSGKSPTAAVQRPWSGLAEGQGGTPTSGFHWGFWKPDGGVSGPFK